MSTPKLVRWSGHLVVLGGVALAAYMLLHPWAARVGEVATTPRWIASHGFHLLSALLLLPGLFGLYACQRLDTGGAGAAGFALALLGTALFAGTGMTSTFLWSAVASEAPAFVAQDGGMFNHVLAVGPMVATRVVFVVGFVWFGVVSWRAGILPRGASVLVVVGTVMLNLPTEPVGPVPWGFSVAGGVVMGLGLVLWGRALGSGAVSLASEAGHSAPGGGGS